MLQGLRPGVASHAGVPIRHPSLVMCSGCRCQMHWHTTWLLCCMQPHSDVCCDFQVIPDAWHRSQLHFLAGQPLACAFLCCRGCFNLLVSLSV